jgi:thioredoxin-related protein
MLKSTIGLALVAFFAISPAFASEVGEDGLHKQSWFSMTFRDIAEDIEQARSEGKRLAITFEQRGCIYCAKMHDEILSDAEVRNYLEENFMIVQYNMFGDEEVTDLDGETLTEKTASRKWGYVFTPTIVFLPEEPPSDGTTVREVDVPQHVSLGQRKGLRKRRAFPNLPRANHPGTALRRSARCGIMVRLAKIHSKIHIFRLIGRSHVAIIPRGGSGARRPRLMEEPAC